METSPTCSVVRDQPLNTRGVDDPSAIPLTWQKLLLQHLLYSVLAAKEDSFRIDRHGLVVVILGGLMDPHGARVGALNADASVVDHDVEPAKFLDTVLHGGGHIVRFGEIGSVEVHSIMANFVLQDGVRWPFVSRAVVEVISLACPRVD